MNLITKFLEGDVSWEGGGTLPEKSNTFSGHMKRFSGYIQTLKQADILLLSYLKRKRRGGGAVKTHTNTFKTTSLNSTTNANQYFPRSSDSDQLAIDYID